MSNNDFNVIPDAPSSSKKTEQENGAANKQQENVSYVKEQPKKEDRKLFANKKMNIFCGIVFGICIVVFIVSKFI